MWLDNVREIDPKDRTESQAEDSPEYNQTDNDDKTWNNSHFCILVLLLSFPKIADTYEKVNSSHCFQSVLDHFYAAIFIK